MNKKPTYLPTYLPTYRIDEYSGAMDRYGEYFLSQVWRESYQEWIRSSIRGETAAVSV